MDYYQKKFLKYQQKYNNQKKRNIISLAIKETYKNIQKGGAEAAASSIQEPGERIELLEKFESLIICPITQQIMVEPVMTSDGQSYERAAHKVWPKIRVDFKVRF